MRLVSFPVVYYDGEAADKKLDGHCYRTAVAVEGEEGNRLVLQERVEKAEVEMIAVAEGNQERLGEGGKIALDGETSCQQGANDKHHGETVRTGLGVCSVVRRGCDRSVRIAGWVAEEDVRG